MLLQLHRGDGLGVPPLVLPGRPEGGQDRPRGRHGHALLVPQEKGPGPARPRPDPRGRVQCDVAVERVPTPARAALQRLRARPGVLWGLVHDPARAVRAVPGPVRGGAHGRLWCLKVYSIAPFIRRNMEGTFHTFV